MSSPSSHNNLEDFRINVKIKLAALWTAVMFCYIYGDYFLLMVPLHIQNLMDGKSGVGATTPMKVLSFAMLMTIPSLMIVLSVFLPAKANRWTNIVVGIIFTLMMTLIAFTSGSEWMLFYVYLAVVESVITLLVVWQAWSWPKRES